MKVLSDELKKKFSEELKIDSAKNWDQEWVRTTDLEMSIIEDYGFEGVRLVLMLEDDFFELGKFPKDCPWYAQNSKSIEEAVESIFKKIKKDVPNLLKILTNDCLYIYAGKIKEEWVLHYLVRKELSDYRSYYSVLKGGIPLGAPKPNESLRKYKWKVPEDLITLYAIHNGFGEEGKRVHSNNELRVMAEYMDPICKEGNFEPPEDYSFANLLEISADFGGNYTAYLREEGENTSDTVVDWDHEIWEISEQGDLFSFIDKTVAHVDETYYEDGEEEDYDELDDQEDDEDFSSKRTRIEPIDLVFSNIKKGEEKIIEALRKYLGEGGKIDLKDKEGKTALVWAAEAGLLKTVQFLIEQGADVNSKDKDKGIPLFWAAYRGRKEMVRLLLDNGASIDAQDNNGDNALMFAAMYGKYKVVKELIERGANLNLKNKDESSALTFAYENGYLKIEKLLKDNGAESEDTEEDFLDEIIDLIYPQLKESSRDSRKAEQVHDEEEDAKADPDKYLPKNVEGDFIVFKDFNFKLCIIQVLMYEENMLEPEFDVHEFVNGYKGRKIDIEEEGYDFIPEVKKYFEDLQIDKKFASLITEINQDGGNEIYGQLIPFWDGEDDAFNILNAEDAQYFPNLKNVTLFYEDKPKVKNQFKKLGIEAEYL